MIDETKRIDPCQWMTRDSKPATDREKKKDATARIAMERGEPFNPADVLSHYRLDDDFKAAQEIAAKLEEMKERGEKPHQFSIVWVNNRIRLKAIATRYKIPMELAGRVARESAKKRIFYLDDIVKNVVEAEEEKQARWRAEDAAKLQAEQETDDYDGLV